LNTFNVLEITVMYVLMYATENVVFFPPPTTVFKSLRHIACLILIIINRLKRELHFIPLLSGYSFNPMPIHS
jgi:hypothetical protein